MNPFVCESSKFLWPKTERQCNIWSQPISVEALGSETYGFTNFWNQSLNNWSSEPNQSYSVWNEYRNPSNDSIDESLMEDNHHFRDSFRSQPPIGSNRTENGFSSLNYDYIQPRMRRRLPSLIECVFCKNNNEDKQVYKSHILKDPDGKILCPVLRAYNCPICHNKGGDRAHTVRYCPNNRAGIQTKLIEMNAIKGVNPKVLKGFDLSVNNNNNESNPEMSKTRDRNDKSFVINVQPKYKKRRSKPRHKKKIPFNPLKSFLIHCS